MNYLNWSIFDAAGGVKIFRIINWRGSRLKILDLSRG